jgi:c-di-GMP-related signal transduction protein
VTAALLSVVDRLYDDSLGVLMGELPMSDSTVRAVLHGAGPVGRALDLARACENDDRALLESLEPGRCDELLDLHVRAVDRTHRTYVPVRIDSPNQRSAARQVT